VNKATLVVPDVHERIWKLKRILKDYSGVSRVVFQCDFFDSFHEPWEDMLDMAHWYAENCQNEKYAFSMGNHDMHYAHPLEAAICAGFQDAKMHAIRGIVKRAHWERMRLHHWVDGYLVTHAGWHAHHLHPMLGFERQALTALEDRALHQLRNEFKVTALVQAGRARGGSAVFGGVTWLDWEDEFQPVPELSQIVGHTPADEVRENHRPELNSFNYCIDTNLNHVALVEDGKVRIESV
jgi:hypothetical protein